MAEYNEFNLDVIKNYLGKYGWEYREVNTDILITDFLNEGIEKNFPLFIRFSPPWIRINIPTFLDIKDESKLTELALHLLRLNYLTRKAFFALTEKDDLTLCMDLFVGNGLDYEHFEAALDIITYVAESSYPPLMEYIAQKFDINKGED